MFGAITNIRSMETAQFFHFTHMKHQQRACFANWENKYACRLWTLYRLCRIFQKSVDIKFSLFYLETHNFPCYDQHLKRKNIKLAQNAPNANIAAAQFHHIQLPTHMRKTYIQIPVYFCAVIANEQTAEVEFIISVDNKNITWFIRAVRKRIFCKEK